MKILVTGATGFVGKYVLKELVYRGHEVVITSRNANKAKNKINFPCEVLQWDPMKGELPVGSLSTVEGVIHLLGESIAAGRWTDELKSKIYNSRIIGTRNLVNSLNRDCPGLKSFVCASAVGFYPSDTNSEMTEETSKGSAWLCKVCDDWESEAKKIKGARLTILRLGVVLGSDGGAMEKMLTPFKMGVGGKLGDGQQWMSWIHVKDLSQLFVEAADNEDFSGVYNAVSPNPVTNTTFTKTLGSVLGRPTLFPVPKFVLKTLFGEMSSILLDSQKVIPKRLSNTSFKFAYADLSDALEDVCRKKKLPPGKKKVIHSFLEQEQWLPKDEIEVFSFFSKPENLESITPKWLNFKIESKSTQEVKEGAVFDYKINMRGIPIKWKTVIEKWSLNKEFVDWQKSGPYKVWHHTHRFTPYQNGTLMEDIVFYKVPFGFVGELLLGAFIKRDIQKIFNHRKKTIEKMIC